MGTIPTSRRAGEVLYLIEHHLDLNLAIEHLVAEYADEPRMKAAKDQRRLAHNILTIGGVGAEKVHRPWTLGDMRYRETSQEYLDGLVLNYNCFRPYQSLKGNTPAEATGTEIPFNSWRDVAAMD